MTNDSNTNSMTLLNKREGPCLTDCKLQYDIFLLAVDHRSQLMLWETLTQKAGGLDALSKICTVVVVPL